MKEELINSFQNPGLKTKIISNQYIQKLQYRHFLIYNVLPFVGTILAFISLLWFPIGSIEIGMVVVLWALTMIGVSVGFHRYYTHRAFKTNQMMRIIFVILGSMAAQGPLISWVAVHRRHHECSDLEGDPHSPNLEDQGFGSVIRGLWHSHFGWLINHDYPNPSYYAPELLRDQAISKISRRYELWIILGLIIPAVLGGLLHGSWIGALQGFLWGGAVRLFIVDNVILSVNSVSHVYGTRPFKTGDQSSNNPWVAIPTLGESWQNNHHAFESSAAIGLKGWQVDLGYWFIWSLEHFGLFWDVNRPTQNMIEAKKLPVYSASNS